MAEFRYPSQTRVGTQAAVDQGLRSYMLGIYNYMALGVAVTAVIIMATFTIPALGAVANVLAFPAMLGLIGMGFFAQRLLMGGTVARAHAVYWVYVALWGIGIAPIVNRYLGVDPSMVMTAFLSASLTFGAMSVWGYTSKRDLSGMGAIAGMALMGLLIAALVNLVVAMFTGVGAATMMISMVISFGFVVFVSLITAWETQVIKEMYVESEGQEAVARKSIFGAFMLYGSFVSIFVNILQILGFMNSSE
ncbi:Bax inhibitor-1 family protein [Aestuariivirga sp.]|uniref:Bax inhibitor-1 family protein n=1 Tax=Aestuariivirga sp. TaxID=2650926 RepID=UPI003784683F